MNLLLNCFNSDSCFVENGNLLCREDFCQLNCNRNEHKCSNNLCSFCYKFIRPGEIIQKAKAKKVVEYISESVSYFGYLMSISKTFNYGHFVIYRN